jgi:hypothetical protein
MRGSTHPLSHTSSWYGSKLSNGTTITSQVLKSQIQENLGGGGTAECTSLISVTAAHSRPSTGARTCNNSYDIVSQCTQVSGNNTNKYK